MKYFKVFETEDEYTEYILSSDCVLPNVSTLSNSTKTWINAFSKDYSKEYFTIESLEDNNVITMTRTLGGGDMGGIYTVSISTDDGGTWTDVEIPQDSQPYTLATLNTGDKVLLKYVSGMLTRDKNSCGKIGSDGRFNAYGNVMSLRNADFSGDTTAKLFCKLFEGSKVVSARNVCLPGETMLENGYWSMFDGCTYLIDVPKLRATTLAQSCYSYMFKGCTSLTGVPSNYLSNTSLTISCYAYMFSGCTSLVSLPNLPATTAPNACYKEMFNGCTSITSLPLDYLPATTLGNESYRAMFNGCTSLTNTPNLPAMTVTTGCYRSMFDTCTSLTVAPSLPATTLGTSAYTYMFSNCSSLETGPSILPSLTASNAAYVGMFNNCLSLTSAPDIMATELGVVACLGMFKDCSSLINAPYLYATSLSGNCCKQMFYGCTGLTTTPSLLATTLAEGCYSSMFKNCKSLTTAPELPATTMATSAYTEMFRGCTLLTDTPVLSATTLANNCYSAMFDGCYSLTGVTTLPATTLADYCYTNMFNGCTGLTTAPDLSATTLVAGCYSQMFKDCTSLSYIKCLATDISATNCTNEWVYHVRENSYRIFVKNSSMSEQTWGRGNNGIPKNWTVYDSEHVFVTGITISTATTTINKDNTYTLTATVLPNDATDKSVTWSTSDSSVATVDSNGVVSGVSCGNATITVTTNEGGYTAQCATSVVNPVTGVSLDTNVMYLITGQTSQLTATVVPSDACGDKSVTWSTSDSSIATVSNNGLVTAVSSGSATITATTTVGSYTATCAIEVSESVAVTGVTLNESTLDITVGQTRQLTATVLPSDATDKSVTWSSSNNNIATVTSNGLITAVSAGTANIIVTTTDGGYTAQCTVTITDPGFTSMVIEGASVVSAETCTFRAICDNSEDVTSSATWSITSGSQYATINSSNGEVTILNGANESSVDIQAVYAGLTATTTATLTYLAGATSETTSEITTDIGGNVTSVVTTVTEYEDGSSTEVVETIVTDVNGDLVGSSESTKTTNADGSYNGATTNYDENGDPVNGSNVTGDTEGNVSTQTVEYDDSGNTTVTGYDIDTSGSESGKTFNSGGTNTEYYAFDLTHGFTLDFDFTIDFSNQPPSQSDGHHNILTAKRADPSPWYGFQIRQSGSNTYIQLGTQFETGSNINTTINPSSTTGNVGSYSLRIVYDPNSSGNKFVCTNMATGIEIYSNNGTFPDLEELKYLRITIGNATNGNGNPFRYSNITVSKFELKKLKYVANPTMTYEYGAITINCSTVGADIYYRFNLSGSYSAYTTPITITADTVVQAYATYSGDTSDIVREYFEIVDVTGVTLSDNSIAIGQGRTYTLTATVLPSDALDKSVTWSSSDSNVASVDSSGVVSGVASGSATITVTTHDGGYTAQCAVSVSASPYTELEYIASTSTGGQYIDLDIMLYDELNKWYDIAIKFNAIGAGKGGGTQPTIFGCQDNTGSPWPGTFIRKDASKNNMVGRYIGGSGKDNTLGQLGNDIELTPKDAPNMNVYNLNNSNKTHTWGTSLFCIFNNQAKTAFDRFIEAKLYYFKLYSKTSQTSQGVLVRDMMPCKRNSDNAIGLLDKVNNVFYTNPSGDAFVAGPVVNS